MDNMNSKEEQLIISLQQYIPLILENKIYFKNYVDILLKQYNFSVDEEHLRKKLNIFFKNSFRDEPIWLAQQLIRGKYQPNDSKKETWFWLSCENIESIANHVIEIT